MRYSLLLVIAVLTLILPSCGSSSDLSNSGKSVNSVDAATPSRFPGALPENRSDIKAMIEGIYVKDKTDFFIKARILSSTKLKNFPNYAITGASYILMPNFVRDTNNKIIDSQSNAAIESLIQNKAGETFNAVIYYEQFKGWFIDEIIKQVK